jgi:hypothetical protein
MHLACGPGRAIPAARNFLRRSAREQVRYAVPFGFIAHPRFAHRDREKFFAFQHEALRNRFGRAVK